jgi:hypothetical protein
VSVWIMRLAAKSLLWDGEDLGRERGCPTHGRHAAFRGRPWVCRPHPA